MQNMQEILNQLSALMYHKITHSKLVFVAGKDVGKRPFFKEEGVQRCPSSIKNNVLYKTLKAEFELLFRLFFKQLVFKVHWP